MPAQEEAGPTAFEVHLGQLSDNLVRNPIRTVTLKSMQTPGCITAAGGRPPADAFPSACGETPDQDLMNYGASLAVGSAKLREWAKAFVQRQHAPPCGWERLDVIMTPGNTNSIAMALMLCSDAGDPVLCEELTYTGLMAAARPLGRRCVGVKMDADGMLPSELRAKAQALTAEGRAARMLYLVPTGHNPTTLTVPEARRRELYAVARECGLLIVEDDPYFHLFLGPEAAAGEADMPGLTPGAGPPSFLALDTDGRVCRFDSSSKILAPGFRLGWLTGPKALTQRLALMAEVLTSPLSGFGQQAMLGCLEELGEEGLHRQVQSVQWLYRRRRDYCLAAFERHLPGLASWSAPEAGMFLWLEVLGVADACRLAEALVDRGVALVPGSAFQAEAGAPCSHFRVSFTQLTEEAAEEAAKRLAAAFGDEAWLASHGCSRAAGGRPAAAA